MNKNIELDLIKRENQILRGENTQLKAHLDYVAMMTDVYIPEKEQQEENFNKSDRFEKVKYYYENNLWNKSMVANAVIKHWITEEEYFLITGEKFTPIN